MKKANNLVVARVGRQEEGLTLLDIVSRTLKLSRKKAKLVIDERRVFVNRKRTWMARHRLSPGDTVEIVSPPRKQSTSAPRILYEDQQYLVVNKPSGMLSNGRNSVENTVRSRPGFENAMAVHRLDRETTGCLLMARSSKAFEKAVSLFKNHAVKKMYHAVVDGRLHLPEKTIREEIDGHTAVTGIKVLDSTKPASHLLARLTTGRTHQIRKHLALMRHPVIGDTRYSRRKQTDDRVLQAPRQMLHASKIEFVHPFTNKRVRVEAPLPKDFKACLRSFGLK